MDIEEMRNLLRNEVVEVTFIKKDGSERILLCSTMEEFLPDMSGSKFSKVSDEIVTVWDLESEGWRSFRFDSMLEYKIIDYVE